MKNLVSKLLLLAFLSVYLSNCKNPLDDIADFRMGIDAGKLLNPAVNVSFGIMGNNHAVPENIIVRIEGEGAQYITDVDGENSFNIGTDGMLKLLLQPGIIPDDNNPIMIKIIAEAKDCLPITEEIYLFSRDKNPDVKLNFYRATTPPLGYKVEEQMALFAGKKAADTLVFEHRNLNGIDFTFKYPVKGAVFVINRLIKYATGEVVISEIEEDSIVGTAYYYRNQLLTRTVKVKRLISQMKYNTKIIPDTIPLENVKARISSNTNPFLETSGFKDAQGRDVNLPRLFTGVVRVPHIDFISSKGEYLSVIYPGDFRKGRLITAKLTDPNVSLYLSGTFYSGDKSSEYISGNAVIPNSKLKFNADNSITFKDDYVFDKEFFFFKEMLVGCGFVNVGVRTSNNLSGFEVYYNVSHGIIQYFRFGISSEPIRLPSFSELGDAGLGVAVDHFYNRCYLKGSELFQNTQSFTPCNYIGGSYDYTIDYDPSPFWEKYRDLFSQVNVSASVQCRNGGIVTLPNSTVSYEVDGVPCTRSQITIAGGRAQLLLLKNKNYVVSVFNHYNQRNIYSSISTNEADQKFSGTIDNPKEQKSEEAYSGTMNYDKINGTYQMHVVFKQPSWKHNMPGCGD